MRKLFLLIFIPLTVWIIGCDDNDKKKSDNSSSDTDTTSQQTDLPIVLTVDASGITSTSAKLFGEVTSTGNAKITDYGFMYSDTATITGATKVTITSDTASYTSFNYTLDSLTSDKIYYFCAFATNSKGTSYGDIKSFTTSSSSVETFIISSVTATSITTTSAKFVARIDGTSKSTVKSFGFVYSDTEPTPTTDNAIRLNVDASTYTPDFTYQETGLYPDRKYYLRAFIEQENDIIYSNTDIFTTPQKNDNKNNTVIRIK